MSNNNEHWHSDFGFAGPQTTFHQQHFLKVVSSIKNCKRTTNGLNPCALTHEQEKDESTNSEAKEE